MRHGGMAWHGASVPGEARDVERRGAAWSGVAGAGRVREQWAGDARTEVRSEDPYVSSLSPSQSLPGLSRWPAERVEVAAAQAAEVGDWVGVGARRGR